MPFGLRNAGNTFQHMMDRILAGLDFCFWYLDDVIVASASYQQHLLHLEQLFSRLQAHGLVINLEKCSFAAATVTFLGHEVSAAGARPLRSHVEAIDSFPLPGTFKQLQAFLGLVNFYRRFLPGVAGILKLLTDVLRGGQSGNRPVPWSAPMQQAFKAAKAAVAAASELAHPVQGARPPVFGGGRVGYPCGSRPSATMRSFYSLSTPGFLFKEAGARADQVLGFRTGAAGLLPGNPTFPLYARGPAVHDFYRSQTFDFCFVSHIRSVDGQAMQAIVLCC
jgi:hypothetical protein